MSFKILFWYWWAFAAVLLVFEMMLPGVVFLFLAIGAAAVGAFLLAASDLSLELQLFVFAIVSVGSAVVLRPTLKRLQQGRPQDATINARGDAMVGKTIVLDAPILNGRGRVKVGDGSWTVTGPDMVAGVRVRVTAVNGAGRPLLSKRKPRFKRNCVAEATCEAKSQPFAAPSVAVITEAKSSSPCPASDACA